MRKRIVIAVVAVLVIGVSCDRRNAETFPEAYGKAMAVYATNLSGAEEALLEYRQKVITSDGFGRKISVAYDLGLVDARLFMVNVELGNKSNAAQWYTSSVSNLNAYKKLNKAPETFPTQQELYDVIVKLDAEAGGVAWRTNSAPKFLDM